MIYGSEYDNIGSQARSEILNCVSCDELEQLRIKYLGRNGAVADLFKKMPGIPEKDRPEWGRNINLLKSELETLVREKSAAFEDISDGDPSFDVTLPIKGRRLSSPHPVNSVMKDIIDIFTSMGFGVAFGPEIEKNYYNFSALNFPEDHPARDMHDTLYLEKEDYLLRTHTSPVQVRMMEKYDPPYKFVAPGKCYRRDTIDASHSPVFHQVEGLLIDEKITFGDLKGVLNEFAVRIFDRAVTSRFRPSFFPFTEPSAEMDIMCGLCGGEGCSSCGSKGWLEILGAGMVDPEVLKYGDVDPEKWQGFAFGMGVERIAMLKYNITDMRLFYQNDMRFLEQF